MAYVAPEDDEPHETGVVIALQVTDQDAAADGLAKLMATRTRAIESERAGRCRVSGDYALIAMTQELADTYAADASRGVAGRQRGLPARHGGARRGRRRVVLDEQGRLPADRRCGRSRARRPAWPGRDGRRGQLAVALRFNESYVEVAVASTGTTLPLPEGDSGNDLMTGLPESTLLRDVHHVRERVRRSGMEPAGGARLAGRGGLQPRDQAVRAADRFVAAW